MLGRSDAAFATRMAKILKKAKRWFEDYGRILGITVVVVSVFAVGIWHSSTLETKAVQEDFGDASISDVAKEISNLDFEDGLKLWEEGEEAKARAVMQRLAPLNLANKKPQGNGLAHFWMAQDLLADQSFGFLEEFPLSASGGRRVTAPFELVDDELIAKAKRHLEAAVALSPLELKPVVMLAEFLIAQGKRNEAVTLLIDAVANDEGSKVDLGLYLVNATRFKGDEIGLEEAGWHRFATLGKEVTGRSRGDMDVRLDYLMTGMLLKEFDAVRRSLRSFERDFEGQNEVISAVKAMNAYARAIALLGQAHLETGELADALIEAHGFQPGREELVKAIQLFVSKFPEQKQKVIDALSSSVSVASGVDEKANLLLFLAAIDANQREGYLEQAILAAPKRQDVIIASVNEKLEQNSPNFEQLENFLSRMDGGGDPAFLLLRAKVAMGQQEWMLAIVALEKVLSDGASGELGEVHALLAQAYRAQGDILLAEEHLAQK